MIINYVFIKVAGSKGSDIEKKIQNSRRKKYE